MPGPGRPWPGRPGPRNMAPATGTGDGPSPRSALPCRPSPVPTGPPSHPPPRCVVGGWSTRLPGLSSPLPCRSTSGCCTPSPASPPGTRTSAACWTRSRRRATCRPPTRSLPPGSPGCGRPGGSLQGPGRRFPNSSPGPAAPLRRSPQPQRPGWDGAVGSGRPRHPGRAEGNLGVGPAPGEGDGAVGDRRPHRCPGGRRARAFGGHPAPARADRRPRRAGGAGPDQPGQEGDDRVRSRQADRRRAACALGGRGAGPGGSGGSGGPGGPDDANITGNGARRHPRGAVRSRQCDHPLPCGRRRGRADRGRPLGCDPGPHPAPPRRPRTADGHEPLVGPADPARPPAGPAGTDRPPRPAPPHRPRDMGIRPGQPPGLGDRRPLRRPERHREDPCGAGPRHRTPPRPVPRGPGQRPQQVHRRDGEEPGCPLRRRRRRRRRPAVRRGRRPLRPPQRGEGQPRPLRQPGDLLPAAAHRGAAGPRAADHQHAGGPRPGLPAAPALRRRVSVPRPCEPRGDVAACLPARSAGGADRRRGPRHAQPLRRRDPQRRRLRRRPRCRGGGAARDVPPGACGEDRVRRRR